MGGEPLAGAAPPLSAAPPGAAAAAPPLGKSLWRRSRVGERRESCVSSSSPPHHPPPLGCPSSAGVGSPGSAGSSRCSGRAALGRGVQRGRPGRVGCAAACGCAGKCRCAPCVCSGARVCARASAGVQRRAGVRAVPRTGVRGVCERAKRVAAACPWLCAGATLCEAGVALAACARGGGGLSRSRCPTDEKVLLVAPSVTRCRATCPLMSHPAGAACRRARPRQPVPQVPLALPGGDGGDGRRAPGLAPLRSAGKPRRWALGTSCTPT